MYFTHLGLPSSGKKNTFYKIQPILPFHYLEIVPSSYFTCLNFEKYIRVYIFMTIQYL